MAELKKKKPPLPYCLVHKRKRNWATSTTFDWGAPPIVVPRQTPREVPLRAIFEPQVAPPVNLDEMIYRYGENVGEELPPQAGADVASSRER